MADENVQYSTNTEFEELTDRDKTTEIIGYIDEVTSAKEVGQAVKYKLLKFTLNNNSGKRITCLVWGDELIQKYSTELKIHRIVHIERGLTKVTSTNYRKEAMNLVPYELIIQKHTDLTFLGYHKEITNAANNATALNVNFDTIRDANGLICIEGYVKTTWVAMTNRYDNSIWGCGAITDGKCKVTVNIMQFDSLDLEKGQAVCVTGQVENKDGFISILCKDVTCIERVLDVVPMDNNSVRNGTRILKRRFQD